MDTNITEKADFLIDETTLEVNRDVSRMYVGNEFCDRRLPSVSLLKRIASEVSGQPRALTLVTSGMTNEGMKRLRNTLAFLSEYEHTAEVVINDWGVLGLLQREYPSFTFVLGRILVSRYLCRNHNAEAVGAFGCLSEKKKFYCFFPEPFLALMKGYGVDRFEFNSYDHLFLTQSQLVNHSVKAHLYFPYTYLTVTRHCLFPSKFEPISLSTVPVCHHECESRYAVLSNPLQRRDPVVFGNARFVREKRLPQNLEYPIDRVIYNDFMQED